MSTQDDELFNGLKWRCKVCMMTFAFSDRGASDLALMESHVKRHRSVVTGSRDPAVENMNWRKFIQTIGQEVTSISQTRYT